MFNSKRGFKNLLKQRRGKKITVDEIIKVISLKFNIKVSDIKSQKKNKNLILPRQIVMYIARHLTNLSFPDIGNKVGGRDHSTVIYSTNKVKKIVNQDAEIKRIVEEIEETLQT